MEKLIIGIIALAMVLFAAYAFRVNSRVRRERKRQEAIQEEQERRDRQADWDAHWRKNGPRIKLRSVNPSHTE